MRVRWLATAVADLRALRAYIAREDPKAARRTARRILEAIDLLADMPGMGRAGRIAGTREFVLSGTPYIVIYRVAGEWLEILRLLHGARRWPRDPES